MSTLSLTRKHSPGFAAILRQAAGVRSFRSMAKYSPNTGAEASTLEVRG